MAISRPGATVENAALFVSLLVVCAAGCGAPSHSADARLRSRPPLSAPTASEFGALRSNVARDDYAGSAACARCHQDIAAAWARSPMHRMTRDPSAAEVRAPFDGTVWHFKNDAVVLDSRGGDRFVRIEPATGARTTYRVTRIIGGRTREDFAGVDVDASSAASAPEVILPVSFVFSTRALRYKGYSVMVHERGMLRAGPVWSRTCIFCHNTVPEMDRLLGAIAGVKGRPYQGEVVDPWLQSERRAHVGVIDPQAFASAASEEIRRLGGQPLGPVESPAQTALRAIDVVREGFDGRALVEVGIGCEACHGGGREHSNDPNRATSMVPIAPWLDVRMPRGNAQTVNHVCARCHQVLFSGYPFTWEGGRRDSSPGGSHINSGEARDFLLGGCAAAMSCTACHDPHGGEDTERMQRLSTPAGNGTCTGCHADLGDRTRLRAHARHDPDGVGGACISCHMPRKNMGLDGTLTRYHRIGSPTDSARVLGDRPLECALCHADRSVEDLVAAMEAWWPVRYPRQRLVELYGPLDGNVIRATLERGKPHERAVAIATLGEAHATDAAPLVAREILSDYPLVREWAKRALESLVGRCDVDLSADDATIARRAAQCGGRPSRR